MNHTIEAMKSSYGLLSALLAGSTVAIPTVYLAGDSTMAVGGGGTGTEGMPMTYSRSMRTNQYAQDGEFFFRTLSKA